MEVFNLPEQPVITIIGKPGSGKSHLIKYLIYLMQSKRSSRNQIVLIFSKTKFNQSFSYVDSRWQHSGFKKEVLQSLMSTQAQIRESGKIPPKVLLVFDDCIQPALFKSELFSDVIYNHRHYNFKIIISFQYMLGNAPTFLRENSDGAFIFQMTTKNSIEGVRDAFGNALSSYEYDDMMGQLGEHKFIYFNVGRQFAEVLVAPADIPDPNVPFIESIDPSKLTDV